MIGWLTLVGGGWQATAALLAFFVSSSALSRWRAPDKHRMADLTARGSQRSAAQVFANGGVASLCILLYALTEDVLWWTAFAGSYAAANADTWASEIGALSPTPPRHILSGRTLKPGDSGGVTVWGILASLAGSSLIAGSAWLAAPQPVSTLCVVGVAVGGVLGGVVDSLLGATVQGRYRCVQCGEIVERGQHCSLPAEQVAGWRWVNNDVVNFACAATGALVGAATCIFFE